MHPTQTIAEDVLISQCKKGSLKHQEMLYKQFYGFAMGISMRYSFNRDDAMEAVNDAFIKVFKSIESYDAGKVFKAWLRAVIINTSIDRRRKDIKHQLNAELDDRVSIPTPHNVIAGLQAADILKLMDALPAIQRTIFNLYEIDGFDHEEIARMINISVSSSRVYLSRAKEKLRTLITAEQRRHG